MGVESAGQLLHRFDPWCIRFDVPLTGFDPGGATSDARDMARSERWRTADHADCLPRHHVVACFATKDLIDGLIAKDRRR